MYTDFQKIINETWIKYRGCLIERTKTGFRRKTWSGFDVFDTIEAAQADIDQSIAKLQNFIKNASR